MHVPAWAVVSAAILVAMSASASIAQTGSGAERYEVTITPPKRPGSETPAVAPAGESVPSSPGPSAADAAGGSAGVPATQASPSGNAGTASSAPRSVDASPPGGAAPVARASAAAPEAVAVPAGPLKSLQIGAFRAQKSATSLHDALAEKFANVEIVEAQSGGEPIFRVNVGRLPRGPGLEELKRQLVAAGYPAFEVVAPPVAAAAN